MICTLRRRHTRGVSYYREVHLLLRQTLLATAFVAALSAILIIPNAVFASSGNLQTALSVGQTVIGIANMFAGPNAGTANPQCNPWFAQCGCNMVPCKNGCCNGGPRSNTNGCPVGICQNTTSGFTTQGICPAAGMCQGVTGASTGGPGGAQGALGLTSQLLQLAQQLMKGGGGGGGAGALPPSSAFPSGCVSTYIVTQPSADPCAIYQPSGLLGGDLGAQSTSNISDALLNALGGGASSGTGGSAATNLGNIISGVGNTSTTTGGSQFSGTTTGQLQSGLTGDVRLADAGATVLANLRQGITEVASFFGGGTFGGGSQSALTRLCSSRPWSGGGFLASVMPDTFFDGLCRRAGYQVGAVTTTGTPSVSTITTQQPQTTPTVQQPQTNVIPPEADIWAEPPSVRLGARAYIFWTTKGVNTCTVTGPSFFHNTLSGAASTVSISGASTFSIECTAPDGTKVTDSVTVNLAI